MYMVPKDHKRALLSHLILSGSWSQVLVFTRTKHGANRLTKQLEQDGIAASAIHGNKSQSARTQALADFKGGRISALVATEVASRGLDIKELPHVVNYELPNVPEDYVHRIGRTGRAGATGIAVSLVSPDESGLLKDIERLLGRRITTTPLPHFELAREAPSTREPVPPRYSDGPAAGARNNGNNGRRHRRHDGRRSSGPGSTSNPGQHAAPASAGTPRSAGASGSSRDARPAGQGAAPPTQYRSRQQPSRRAR
jgi:ATP-dependent RNA helicase RhlE